MRGTSQLYTIPSLLHSASLQDHDHEGGVAGLGHVYTACAFVCLCVRCFSTHLRKEMLLDLGFSESDKAIEQFFSLPFLRQCKIMTLGVHVYISTGLDVHSCDLDPLRSPADRSMAGCTGRRFDRWRWCRKVPLQRILWKCQRERARDTCTQL